MARSPSPATLALPPEISEWLRERFLERADEAAGFSPGRYPDPVEDGAAYEERDRIHDSMVQGFVVEAVWSAMARHDGAPVDELKADVRRRARWMGLIDGSDGSSAEVVT